MRKTKIVCTIGPACNSEETLIGMAEAGMNARMVSRFRCPVPIVGMTTDEKTWRKLSLSWGVLPAMSEMYNSTDVLFYEAKKLAKQSLDLKKGDRVVITGGMTNGSSGNTNMIKVETV